MNREFIFKTLQRELEERGFTLSVSSTVKHESVKTGTQVVVGGKITRIYPDVWTYNDDWVMEIDDDVDTIAVFMFNKVYKAFEDVLEPGNIVVVKGRVVDRTKMGVKMRYIAASSIELI